jgi:hypothetical protein
MSGNNSVIDSNSHSNIYTPKISYNSLGFGIVVNVFGFNDNVIHMFEVSKYIYNIVDLSLTIQGGPGMSYRKRALYVSTMQLRIFHFVLF